jgi:hypothetical protein
MNEPSPAASRRRLRRSIVLCVICVTASGLGMLLAHPIAAQFHSASPWILPAIAVGVLVMLLVVALLMLPGSAKPRRQPPS